MIDVQQLAARVPLFAGLAAHDLHELLRVMRRHTFDAGDALLRHGRRADSALFVEVGMANAVAPLPGGGQAVLAEFGPGSVLGEMALLEDGVRMANVIAAEPTACFSMERDAFRAIAAQGNRAARALQQRITLALCRQLRALNGKILAASEPEALAPAVATMDSGISMRRPAGFECRSFLPLLAAFSRLNEEDLDELMRVVTLFELPRGAPLFRAGEPGTACFVVVRGALEISREQQGLQRRIGILGPGRICGVLGLIEGAPHSMSAAARETATLMEIPAAVFHRYHAGEARGALKFQSAVNRELMCSLERTNNHLTRLISQARIHKRDDEAHELQCDLIAQECRAAA